MYYDVTHKYLLDNFPRISENIQEIINDSSIIHAKIKQYLQTQKDDVTSDYYRYNFFTFTGGSVEYYHIFKFLQNKIKEYFELINEKPDYVWIQSWINVHTKDNVLTKHNHTLEHHGYISILPQDTKTVFLDDKETLLYSIENKIGNFYVGPAFRNHYVENLQDYNEPRVTIGFDISTKIQPPLTGNIMFPIVLNN